MSKKPIFWTYPENIRRAGSINICLTDGYPTEYKTVQFRILIYAPGDGVGLTRLYYA